jgi:hypothetical protein
MSNADLVRQIEEAKDSVGVITPASLHDQLNSLTANDWRQAAAIYSKSASGPDGFYIDDDASGKVTIHNDLTQAHKLADNSVLSATVDDAKVVGAVAVGATAVIAGSWGATLGLDTWAAAGVGSGVGLLSSEVLTAGAVATGAALVTVGEVVGVISAAVLAGDMVRNYYRKSDAQEDIRNASGLSFQSR